MSSRKKSLNISCLKVRKYNKLIIINCDFILFSIQIVVYTYTIGYKKKIFYYDC